MPYVYFNFELIDFDDICCRPELNYDNKETEIIFPYIMNTADHHITYISIALAVAYTILFKRGKIKENEIIYLKQNQKRIYQSYMSRMFTEVLLSDGEISEEEYDFLRNRQEEIIEKTVIYNEEKRKMNEEEKKQVGKYNVDLAHIRAEITLKVVKYALENNLMLESVLHDVFDGLAEDAIRSLKCYQEVLKDENYKNVMNAIKRHNDIREKKLKNGNFTFEDGKIKVDK